ncbi:MAG: protein translocase subunit SecF [Gammaproteobacteria bacterium]|nr:protein translocase subunit SecF [Gammaproteobacteria bacterium]
MKLFGKTPNFRFMQPRVRVVNAAISVVLVVVSIVSFVLYGFNLGLDFKGGIQLELAYSKPVEISQVRQVVAELGFTEAVIQSMGSTRLVSIRLPVPAEDTDAHITNQVVEALKQKTDPGLEVRQQDFVGAKMGAELRDDGGTALLIVLGAIFVYVFLRFEWRSSLAALIATLHDVIITAGCFSLFHWPFDLTVLAALLAVIGYSLNDTVVVYDRIRENFRKMRGGTPVDIVNSSMNQTLSRTIITSFVTLLAIVAMFVWGGEVLRPFSIALMIGIGVGTYSSIYVASSVALWLGLERIHLLPVVKEGSKAMDDSP